MSEWNVAARHNRDARCNCLIPVLLGGPNSGASGSPAKAPVPATPTTASSSEDASVGSGSTSAASGDVRTKMDAAFAKRMTTCASNIMVGAGGAKSDS